MENDTYFVVLIAQMNSKRNSGGDPAPFFELSAYVNGLHDFDLLGK